MDDRRFDSISRALAGGLSRRRVVAGLAASVGIWLTGRSSRVATAQEKFCSDCSDRGGCPEGNHCRHKGCYCVVNEDRVRGASRTASIETDLDGTIVAATSDGPPATLVMVDRICPDTTGCKATLTFAEDGATVAFLVAQAEISSEQEVSLRFVGVGIDYLVSVNPSTANIETITDGRLPSRGTHDPATGHITGLGNGLILPDDMAALIVPLAPALEALIGSAVLGSGGIFCPPGPTRPDRPVPAGTPVSTPDDPCPSDCQFGVSVAVAACCDERTDLACLVCAAAGASVKKGRHRNIIVGKGGDAMPIPNPTITGGGDGATPTSTSTPDDPAASAPKATSTPGACGADERPCADRCIPASECPAASCCLSPESCECVCPDCGEHGVFAPNTCRCACNADALPCGEGCMPIAECPPESCCLSAETCLCTCPDCGPNGALDPVTCGCTCGQVECPPNFVLDETTCSCTCGMTECSPDHVWDLEACTCTCVPKQCTANQVFDESLCDCVCGLSGCPPNYIFDEANCACLCAAQCPPTFVFDEATCSCLCLLEGCPPNLTFTPESCACYCEPPACPPGYVVDQVSCTCFCPEVACLEGQVFDPASCACVGSGAAGAVEGVG